MAFFLKLPILCFQPLISMLPTMQVKKCFPDMTDTWWEPSSDQPGSDRPGSIVSCVNRTVVLKHEVQHGTKDSFSASHSALFCANLEVDEVKDLDDDGETAAVQLESNFGVLALSNG